MSASTSNIFNILLILAVINTLYQRLSDAVAQFGYSIKDAPKDGNCGLHAVVDQLCMRGITTHNVTNLRQKAVEAVGISKLVEGVLIMVSPKTLKITYRNKGNQRVSAELWGIAVTIVHSNDYQSTLYPPANSTDTPDTPLILGLITDYHYVSLQPISATLLTNTV